MKGVIPLYDIIEVSNRILANGDTVAPPEDDKPTSKSTSKKRFSVFDTVRRMSLLSPESSSDNKNFSIHCKTKTGSRVYAGEAGNWVVSLKELLKMVLNLYYE